MIFMKVVAQGLGTQHRKEFVRICRFRLHKIHGAKPPRVVKGDPRTIGHMKHHVVVFLGRRVVVHELSQRIARDQHASRHAKVNEQRFPTVEISENVL